MTHNFPRSPPFLVHEAECNISLSFTRVNAVEIRRLAEKLKEKEELEIAYFNDMNLFVYPLLQSNNSLTIITEKKGYIRISFRHAGNGSAGRILLDLSIAGNAHIHTRTRAIWFLKYS